MNKFKVYLAGAITGMSYDESENWRVTATKQLAEKGIDGYSPLRRKDFLRTQGKLEGSYTEPLATARGIMTRDYNDVNTSDALLVNILGTTQISVGTAMEVGWAWEKHKPVVLVSEVNNIHLVHPMFAECISYRVDNIEDGVDTISSILLP